MRNDIKYAKFLYANLVIAEDMAMRIARLYKKEFELVGIFDKTPTHRMTHAEAEILLSQVKNLKDRQNIINYANSFLEGEKRANLISFAKSPLYPKRYKKLERLFGDIDSTLGVILMNEVNIAEAGYDKIIDNAYYRTCHDIQRTLGRGHIVPGPKLSEEWKGKTYKERLTENSQLLSKSLKDKMLVAFFSGLSEKQSKEWLRATMNGGAKTSHRLIRTEATYLANQGMIHAFRDCGVEYYEYVAILDMRTSLMCRNMDGKIFRVTDAVVGVNLPPLHPWCRSSIAPYMRDVAILSETEIPKNIPYDTWYEKFGKEE